MPETERAEIPLCVFLDLEVYDDMISLQFADVDNFLLYMLMNQKGTKVERERASERASKPAFFFIDIFL